MKNLAAFLLAAALMLSMAACSEKGSTAENDAATQQSVEASTEQDSEEEDTEAENTKDSEKEENSEESAVDYSGELAEWLYQPEMENETTLALMEIDTCEYGTAGASLKQTSAAVQVLKLTQSEDITEALNAYLDGMNATQKDYFSFQWQMAVNEAEQLLTEEDAATRLEESGHGDLDLAQFNIEGLAELHETVTTALNDHGVTDVWKTHIDLEPFMNWGLDSFRGEIISGTL